MNHEPRKPKLRHRWTAEHDAVVQHLEDAAQQVRNADTPISQEQLRSAVDAARDAGVGWTRIGDTLGIASGNAYHRYRKRRGSTEDAQPCDAARPPLLKAATAPVRGSGR